MIIKGILIIAGLAAIVFGIYVFRKTCHAIVATEDAHFPYPYGDRKVIELSAHLWEAAICILAGIIVLIVGLAIK